MNRHTEMDTRVRGSFDVVNDTHQRNFTELTIQACARPAAPSVCLIDEKMVSHIARWRLRSSATSLDS